MNGVWKMAREEAYTRSKLKSCVQPQPMAAPLTAAIRTFGKPRSLRLKVSKRSRMWMSDEDDRHVGKTPASFNLLLDGGSLPRWSKGFA